MLGVSQICSPAVMSLPGTCPQKAHEHHKHFLLAIPKQRACGTLVGVAEEGTNGL